MLIDSHCHLNFPELKNEIPEILERAKTMGVTTFLTVNTKLSEAAELQHISDLYPPVFCSVGVHPHEATTYLTADLLGQIKAFATHPKVIALGETGLDYHYDHSPRAQQQESFRVHLEAGHILDLPIIVHTREADEDTLACLDDYPQSRGVFHCFTGNQEMAKAGLDRGYFISFSGIITFKNSEALREVVRYVPLDRMLVETDAPFLAPIPHRGKRNEPAYTRYTAEKISEIKGISLSQVAEQTTQNFYEMFPRAVPQRRISKQ